MSKNVVVKCPMCESKTIMNKEQYNKLMVNSVFWDCNVCGNHFFPTECIETIEKPNPFKYIEIIQVCCIAVLCSIFTYKTNFPIHIRLFLAFVETSLILSFWSGMRKIYYRN